MSTTIELNDSQIEALTKTKECITLLDYGTEVPADIMLNFLEKKSEATQNECALALGYKDDAKVLLKTLRDMTTPPSPVDTPPKSDAVVPPTAGDNKEQERLSQHADESTPAVLNFVRAIELGLIGATPKESLSAFSAMKGNGFWKGSWNALKAGNDRIPGAMNWSNYFHTHPWIRPDLAHMISLEKAANKALLANKNLLIPTREALQLREQYLIRMNDALVANDLTRFGQIAAEYRTDATSGKIAREATHIDDAIKHSILKENIPEHEKATIKTKEKADKDLVESTKKVEELKAEHKRLEEEIKAKNEHKISLGEDVADKDRLIALEKTEITANESKLKTAETNYHESVTKINDLSNSTHKTAAIESVEGEITRISKEIKTSGLSLDDVRILKEGLAEKKSELTKLLSAEENRLNKIMEENKRKMEKLHDTIESSKKEVKSLESEKTKLAKEQGKNDREITEKTTRKDAIKNSSGAGELKTQEALKATSETTIKNHEQLQKAKVALETELARPHADPAEVNRLRTEYQRLAASGTISTLSDVGRPAHERLHQVEKVSYEQAKVEVERIESRLTAIEGEINTKLSAVEENLKTGNIPKVQADIEVDKIINPYNQEFETIQKRGLVQLETLDKQSFKDIMGQSHWLRTINKGNVAMDKVDGKVGKWAGLAVVGLVAKHGVETGWTPELKNDLEDMAIGMIPIVGGVHDLNIAWDGRDMNGRKVEGWDRAGRVAFGVLGLTGVGALAKFLGKGAQATNLVSKTGILKTMAEGVEKGGETGMRILEPVRLAGRPIMYTTLGISLYQCMVAPMLSK